MEEIIERLKDYFVQDNITAAQVLIDGIISEYEWKEIVLMLKNVTKTLYLQHLLKRNHMVLSLFGLQELRGIDCDLFSELVALPKSKNLLQASNFLFDNLIQITISQLKNGGSTLFFNVEELKKTKSVIIIPDLIEARYRETIFVLAEIDQSLLTVKNEWVNVSRLWRIGNGLRLLKARNHGMLIHIDEYREIRNRILIELGIRHNDINREKDKLIKEGNSKYLQLSESLDNFVLSYITSLGIRGKFEPYYKSMIDHEGLDAF